MKYVLPAIRFKIFMILLLGIGYTFFMTGVSQLIFPQKSHGEFAVKGDQKIGVLLIAQKFESSKYFWPRPSAVDYNPLPSGGSNFGPISAELKKIVDERKKNLKSAHSDQTMDPPQELYFASASGLDPHISIEAAFYQAHRVSLNREISMDKLKELIEKASAKRQWGFLGEATVNVLQLNLLLDQSSGS